MGNSTDNNCSVRILSRTDGRQSVFTSVGNLYTAPSGSRLRYRQGESFIVIETDGETVKMLREGDFYIRLQFCEGKRTEGEIGLSPQSKGEVGVDTERASVFRYAGDNKLKIILNYALFFSSGEEQRVSLQLIAERTA